MDIEFVNHSSFIINHKGIKIMCDPWLEGAVFNNGWSLISKSKFTYEDFADVDFIWFSHEHPDHFFPPNIAKIPEQHRNRITVLFQYTEDKRVVNYCKNRGFKEVIELYPDKWFNVHEDLKLLCEHFQEGDSWICFKSAALTYLNTNDCDIRNKKEVKKILNKVGPVDILLSQFSYAYWVGNPEDKEYRNQKAQEKLKWLKFQCDAFNSKITIPIASYIYFSHIENSWLNDSINTPQKTYNFLKNNTLTEPIILYCGDKYKFGHEHNSFYSLQQYQSDYDNILNTDLYSKTNTVPATELSKEAVTFIDNLNKNNSWLLKKKLVPAYIFIIDYNQTFVLSLKGFNEVNRSKENCDVLLTSENLHFCLKYPYGLDTTQINGRMLRPKKGNYSNFYNFFRINQLKSRGINPNSISYLTATLIRKVLSKFGLLKN